MANDIFIGAGGWGHFSGGLRYYAKAFSFVEVNNTFYRLPDLRDVARWRRSVPNSFEFSVKANRQITHSRSRIDASVVREHLAQTIAICKLLKARWLVLQYPRWREFDSASSDELRNLISSVEKNPRICIEARAYQSIELPLKFLEVMKDIDTLDVIDPIVQDPRLDSDEMYMRIFGKGEHNVYQPSDEELEDIDERTSRGSMKSLIFTFHGVRMYKDATRFETFKKTGKFPKVTRGEGISSLDEILREDARYPSSKEILIQHQGWKLIDLARSKRVRASILLNQLEDRIYRSTSDVISALKSSTV